MGPMSMRLGVKSPIQNGELECRSAACQGLHVLPQKNV